MCSVSWLFKPQGYQVFFNRDEQKTRAPALPPKQQVQGGVKVLMPIDPVGNGSWICTNQFGLSLCLLNNYQGSAPKGELLSRGLLLKSLATCRSSHDVIKHFYTLSLEQFAPFTLLSFDPTLSINNQDVIALRWNGEKYDVSVTDSPLFSSAIDLEAVVNYRQKIYHELTKITKDTAALLAFHTHHHPVHLHMSPCMHREDAHTVSFTYLNISASHQEMSYIEGSPCSQLTEEILNQKSIHFLTSETLTS